MRMGGGFRDCTVCKAPTDLSDTPLNGKDSVCLDCSTSATNPTFPAASSSRYTASLAGAECFSDNPKKPFVCAMQSPPDFPPPARFPSAAWATATAHSSSRIDFLPSRARVKEFAKESFKQSVNEIVKEVAPIAMQSAAVKNESQSPSRSRQSPPFTFVATPNNGARPNALADALETVPLWRCAVCYKVKELSGSHLDGKSSVRSDCLVCAKKRVFFLSIPAGDISPRSSSTGTNALLNPSQNAETPTSDAQNGGNRIISTENGPHSLLPNTLTFSGPLLTASFEGEVLREYRHQLFKGVRARTVWHQRSLYVLPATRQSHSTDIEQTETIQNINSSSGAETDVFSKRDVAMLGEAAATLLAVEHKLATSPFRVMRRLFCPDEFTFAAACMYANTFLSSHDDTSAKQSPFVIFGPREDQTVPKTRWRTIIKSCAVARQVVVSEEQRVEGAQCIFCTAGWLTLPLHATAEAIRLAEDGLHKEKEKSHKEVEREEEKDEQALGVDVILVRETMRLEDLPKAAALAMPVKPF